MDSYDDDLEKPTEHFPDQAEIEALLATHLQGKEYSITRSNSDDKGVLIFEAEMIIDGEKTVFNYQRATYDHTNPERDEYARFSASLHSVSYDSDGMPQGGKCIANYRDGQWLKP